MQVSCVRLYARAPARAELASNNALTLQTVVQNIGLAHGLARPAAEGADGRGRQRAL